MKHGKGLGSAKVRVVAISSKLINGGYCIELLYSCIIALFV